MLLFPACDPLPSQSLIGNLDPVYLRSGGRNNQGAQQYRPRFERNVAARELPGFLVCLDILWIINEVKADLSPMVRAITTQEPIHRDFLCEDGVQVGLVSLRREGAPGQCGPETNRR